MRPRELTVRGFRSYADETSFGWDDRNLVGIVGPIGSGKTSILDAVCFALYGKTPRIERDTKSLINQRREALHVALVFEVDGAEWKAVRTLRRGGASSHTLYRIEDEGETVVTDRAREMTERIEDLLGLDFDAFRRSVLLAQNQFALFLEATGTDRNQVLKGVFGFDRLDAMRASARDRLDALTGRLAVLADRRKTADADRRELEEKRRDLEVAEVRVDALEELRIPFEETKQITDEAAARAAASGEQVARLEGLADRIPSPQDAEDRLGPAEQSEQAVESAAEAHEAAVEQRVAAAAAAEEVLASVGGRDGLDSAGDRVGGWKAARRQAEAAAAEGDKAQTALQAAVQAVAVVRTARDDAVAVAAAATRKEAEVNGVLQEAQEALQAAHREHRAHALRGDLVVGEPCPVCLQQVDEILDTAIVPQLDEAQAAVDQAALEVEKHREEARQAAAEAARFEAELAATEQAQAAAAEEADGATKRASAGSAELIEAEEAVAELLGEGDPEQRLEELRRSVASAEKASAQAVVQEESARTALEAARSTAGAAAEAMEKLRTDLATVAGTLEAEVDLEVSPESVRAGLAHLRDVWIEQMDLAQADQKRATEEAEAALAARRDLLQGAGLAESDDVVDVLSVGRSEVTGLAGAVEVLEKRLTDLETLDADEANLVAESETLSRLHSDLSPSRFLEFVLDERRRSLGDLASEHLEVLTAGRYRFDESGEFLVVDLTAADAVRAPTSLSGGESFLASLALALALAEVVSREGGRLDAFFLDEGFGSLDPEHLDLAMDGIERLVTTGAGRLVVVVSHVAAMRERIEDLMQLDRDPITGDTRVVAGAS